MSNEEKIIDLKNFVDDLICNNEYNIEFAKIRKYGSIAYIFGSFLGGIFVKELGYSITFLISGIAYLLSFVTFKFIKPFKEKEIENTNKNKIILILKAIYKITPTETFI